MPKTKTPPLCFTDEKKKKPHQHSSKKLDDIKVPLIHQQVNDILDKIEMRNLKEAEAEAKSLYALHPNDYYVNFLQGICCIQRQNFGYAADFFNKSIEINPWFFEAHFNLGFINDTLGNLPDAVDNFTKVVELDGEDGVLGQRALKKLEDIRDDFESDSNLSLEEIMRDYRIFEEASNHMYEMQYKKAIPLLQKILKKQPNHIPSHVNISLAYSKTGKQKKALQHIDKCLLLEPDSPGLLRNRAILLELQEGESNPCSVPNLSEY